MYCLRSLSWRERDRKKREERESHTPTATVELFVPLWTGLCGGVMNNHDARNTFIHFGIRARRTKTWVMPGKKRRGRKPPRSLTRYSKTSVSDLSVWTMSCSVTMLACFRSFSNDTVRRHREGERTVRTVYSQRSTRLTCLRWSRLSWESLVDLTNQWSHNKTKKERERDDMYSMTLIVKNKHK